MRLLSLFLPFRQYILLTVYRPLGGERKEPGIYTVHTCALSFSSHPHIHNVISGLICKLYVTVLAVLV